MQCTCIYIVFMNFIIAASKKDMEKELEKIIECRLKDSAGNTVESNNLDISDPQENPAENQNPKDQQKT